MYASVLPGEYMRGAVSQMIQFQHLCVCVSVCVCLCLCVTSYVCQCSARGVHVRGSVTDDSVSTSVCVCVCVCVSVCDKLCTPVFCQGSTCEGQCHR